MKKTFFVLVTLSISVIFSFSKTSAIKNIFPEKIELTVENEIKTKRTDETITLNVNKLKKSKSNFNPEAFIVQVDGKEVPSQASDIDNNGTKDQILFNIDLKSNSTKTVIIRYKENGKKKSIYEKRTQAELSHKYGGQFKKKDDQYVYEGGEFKNVNYLDVPPQHTDHSYFIRYEGPGWESDKIGYRMYLDWRNGFDIYGKKTSEMVLQEVGQDGFESYHEMSDWGMDILKVGSSLGIGSFGLWHNNSAERVSDVDNRICEICADGEIKSQLTIQYHGWKVANDKYNLTSNLSIKAGDRKTKNHLEVEGNPPNLCTGLVKHGAKILKSESNKGNWAYFATYGEQSLSGDKLGMAILYNKKNLKEITEDKNSHVIVFDPKNDDVTYYFLAAWEREPDGIKNRKSFQKYLEKELNKINNPINIQY